MIEVMVKENTSNTTPASASTSSCSSIYSIGSRKILDDVGLNSIEQAKLCASPALLKLFEEHDSAQDFFSTSDEDTTERKLFCAWLNTIVNTNMSALVDPTVEIPKSKRTEIINVAANIICCIMTKDYNLSELSNPKVTEHLSKLISQRRSRKKNELMKLQRNQVKYYMLLASCI